MSRTAFGNSIYATGGDPVAARGAGVPTNLVKIILFIATGVAAAFVGVIQGVEYHSGNATAGLGYVFQSIIVAVVGGVFLITLLVVSVLTIRISDMVLDSRVGAIDRTMGFLFGLARGLVIVVVAYTFFDWLVPDRSKPDWVLHAKSKVVLSSTGDWLKAQLPENAESTILNKLKPKHPGDTDTPDNPQPDQQHG